LLLVPSLGGSCFTSYLWALDERDIVNLLEHLLHAKTVHLAASHGLDRLDGCHGGGQWWKQLVDIEVFLNTPWHT